MKFHVTIVKSKFQICGNRRGASERRANESDIYQLWILLNLWEKCLKFGENGRNIQKIYDSVRKLRTSRWMSLYLIALESNANLPDLAVREDGWEVESLIVPCEVLLVQWNHSTSSGSTGQRYLVLSCSSVRSYVFPGSAILYCLSTRVLDLPIKLLAWWQRPAEFTS